MTKRLIIVAALAAMLVLAFSSVALAEGYNMDTDAPAKTFGGVAYSNSSTYGLAAGFYTRADGYFSGPHGGYTTSTNKCQDCHSTHYALGSFMLLRANNRQAACDFCHGGGGGSTINIMMDNTYKTNTSATMWLDGVANYANSTGNGTGHSLGWQGNAPADINPAFTAGTAGFACFDCHTPHGNSARVMPTMANPGRAMGTNNVVKVMGTPGALGTSTDGILNVAGEWGIDPTHGNFKWFGDPWPTGAGRPADDTTGGRLIYRPIWPKGSWLLLKNPHKTASEGQTDTVVAGLGAIANNGVNKYKIDWDEPLGPADGNYFGGQDNDNDNNFPFAPQVGGQGGFGSVSEFCVDCHDGTAGASTQGAVVWLQGTGYITAYAHDTQPRH